MSISPDWFYGSDYLFTVLCAAFALEFILGGLPGFSHILSLPRTVSVYLARRADRRLNRAKRSNRSRKLRGALVIVFLVPLAAIGGLYAADFCRTVADGWIVEAVFVAMCVGLQRPLMNAGALRRALARKSLDRARAILGRVVGYETETVDEHGLARGSVEMFAVRLCDGLVGPVFWYLIAGLPGLFVYRITTALADELVHPTEKHAAFGSMADAMDRLMNFVAAPVTAILIVAGTLFAPTARPLAAIRGMIGGATAGRSPREGWTQGAVAGALGLSLSGPRRHDGAVSPGVWIGDGRARANSTDIARAMWLYLVAGFLGLAPLVLLALVAHRF
jgi:adenosylcobinamide-phosphate synthase